MLHPTDQLRFSWGSLVGYPTRTWLTLLRSPQVRRVAPLTVDSAPVSRGALDRDTSIIGTTADFLEVRRLHLAQGHFLPRGQELLLDPGDARAMLEWANSGFSVAASVRIAAHDSAGLDKIVRNDFERALRRPAGVEGMDSP